jgi:hypothetical protein
MAKLDPDLVQRFLGADDAGKLKMLCGMDTSARDTLLEFLDVVGVPEASPTAEPVMIEETEIEKKPQPAPKMRKVTRIIAEPGCKFREVTTFEPEVSPSPAPPVASSGRDEDGFLLNPVDPTIPKAAERKYNDAGFLIGDRPKSVFPYQNPYRAGSHWSR